jgi:adenosylhomocysteinase
MSTNAAPSVACDVKALSLAEQGKRRIEWAFHSMPVLQNIRKQFIKMQPLAGVRVAACLHVTAETANLMMTLRDGGASLVLCGSNPLSTQDDVAASLVKDYGIPTYAIKGETQERYYAHILAALDHKPQVTMDEGGDLVTMLHTKRQAVLPEVLCGTEETATGVKRIQAMAKDGALAYPVIAINDAQTKHLFDNRYGTGQSTMDGILRATNYLIAGMSVVVAGLRLVRAGRGEPGARAGRERHRYRSRPNPGIRSPDGWLPHYVDGRGGRDWRPVRDCHWQQTRDRPGPFRQDEERRCFGKFWPLQCRAGLGLSG